MSEHENNHEDIARRLRAEGQATAPPDLMPAVMAEVRTEPRRASRRRRRSLPNWRPLTAWAAAAAVLVAIGYGISHVGGGTSSSSGGESTSAAASGERAAAPALAGVGARSGSATFTVEQDAAKNILGTRYPLYQAPAAVSGNALTPLRVRVPAKAFRPYALKLAAAQNRLHQLQSTASPTNIVIIKLIRAHAP